MYPIMLNLKGKQAVIVGGGQVAARKIRSLLEEGASVQVISPSLDPQIPQEQ
ncbi:bifunctional precorrin-2 dehydrogenase/sirohydrochlorin ferrochelatase, partial [Streptococcus danieliae]